MAWVTGREWFWRLAASRLVAHLVRLFLSFKEYKGRKRLLVLRLNIKVAVVTQTLLLVAGGGGLIHHYPPNPASFPNFGESRFSGSSQIPSLRASSLGRSDGGAGQERTACNYVSGIWISPPNPLWLPVDWAVRCRYSNSKDVPPERSGPESLLAGYQILYHSNVSRIPAIPFQTLHHTRFAVLLTLLTNAWPTCTGVI